MDEPEGAFPFRNRQRLTAGARAQDARSSPVAREAAPVGREEHRVDRARRCTDVLLVLDQVTRQRCGRDDERGCTLELRRFRELKRFGCGCVWEERLGYVAGPAGLQKR